MFLMLTLFFLGAASVNAQVTIGSNRPPAPGIGSTSGSNRRRGLRILLIRTRRPGRGILNMMPVKCVKKRKFGMTLIGKLQRKRMVISKICCTFVFGC